MLLGTAKVSSPWRQRILGMVKRHGVILPLMLIIAAAAILEPSFSTASNFANILRQAAVLGIVCLGVTFVMMTGSLDLSVGSILSLCSVFAIHSMNTLAWTPTPVGAPLIMSVTVLLGALVGVINGVLIAVLKGRLGETFIITYGMQIVVASVALLYSGGQFVAGTFRSLPYETIGTGYYPIIIFFSLAALMHIVLSMTVFGRRLAFIGSNMDCARMSGIRVGSVRAFAYAISGACSAVAAMIVTSRVNSASPLQGVGYELEAIAAIVVGGTSLTGGEGGIINTVVGVLILSVLGNALNVMGIGANTQLVVRGTIIVAAVALDTWNKAFASKGYRA